MLHGYSFVTGCVGAFSRRKVTNFGSIFNFGAKEQPTRGSAVLRTRNESYFAVAYREATSSQLTTFQNAAT